MADKQATTDVSPVPTHDPKQSSDYIPFPCLPPGGPLNRWSTKVTREHDYPGAQVWPSIEFPHHVVSGSEARLGHALRSRRPQQGQDEERAPGRHRDRLVAGQPLQVSL